MTGIDRVELAYIEYLIDTHQDSDVWFILTTSYGHGALSREEMQIELKKLQIIRSRREKNGRDPVLEQICEVLEQETRSDRQQPLRINGSAGSKNNLRRAYFNMARLLIKTGKQFNMLIRSGLPAVYFHTSHTELDKPASFEWLRGADISSVFLIHDLIPIQYPEFCPPKAARRHQLRMQTVSDHADIIIANSNYTAEVIKSFFISRSIPPVPTVISTLANTIQDGKTDTPSSTLNVQPYFLHVGTIEGRKNVGHLLNVWRDIIASLGPDNAPRLVLAGKRGWECENVFAILDRSHELANHVIEVSGLSDESLSVLMSGSKGLVTMSFVEGYGLPPVEAAQRGIKVIASDIPAHREVLQDHALFVGPTDGQGLKVAIESVMKTRASSDSANVYQQKTRSWNDHVNAALVSSLALLKGEISA
jgi:glycosyltransferase involved in cell wall biosynthesis